MMTKKLLLSLVIIFAALIQMTAQTIKQLNSVEIQQILSKNKQIVILDVRTPQEFASGHLKGALNIDIYKEDFYSRIDKLNKKTSYLIYCRTHNRSDVTVKYMNQKGFETVFQMMDGFPGWAANNFTIKK